MKMKRWLSRVGGSKKGRRRVLRVKWGLGLFLLMRHRCPLPTGSAAAARCRRGRTRNVQVQILSEGGISLVVVGGPFHIEQILIGRRGMKLKRELCRGVMRRKVVGVRGSLERKIRIVTGVAVAAAEGRLLHCVAEVVERGGKRRRLQRVEGGIEGARRQDQTKWAAGRS